MEQGWRRQRSASPSGSGSVVVRKHRPDHLIALYAGMLMLIGLVLIYAIGPQRANVLNSVFGYDYSDTYFFVKQLVSFVLAVGSFVFFAMLPYKWVTRYATQLLILGLLASVILAIAAWAGLPIVQTANGATRWFDFGPLGTLQPAEVLKFGVLAYVAVFLAKKAKEGPVNDWKNTLYPVMAVTSLSLLLIVVVQKDLGTGIALAAIVFSMLFIAGLSWRNVAVLSGALLVIGLLLIVSAPHRMERVMTYLQGDSSTTQDDGTYHIQQAKIALGSGGLFGVGIGESVQASGYLPEAINDSIFAVFGETFGFVGTMALIVLFVALLMRMLRVMDRLADLRLKLLVAGVFGWFGAHVILNIAAMIGIFPLTGITLPLLSYGGTSMVFMTAALGLVYQLSRYTVHESRIKEETHDDSRSRRGVGRTRNASRRSS